MSEPRPVKHIQFRHDGVCQSPACVKPGGTIKAGTFGWWAPENIIWHEGCPDPKEALSAPWEDTLERFDAWCDRKIDSDHERHVAQRAMQDGASDDATGSAATTSDPRHEDSF